MDELGFKKWFKNIVEDSGKKIESSNTFMSIFSTDYKESPQCALELGIAIMLNKPIVLIVVDGTEVPLALEKIAVSIQKVRKDSKQDMDCAIKTIRNQDLI